MSFPIAYNAVTCQKILVFACVFLTGAINVAADQDLGLCCLCDGCRPPLEGRRDMFVDNKGTTCNTMTLEMANPDNNSKQGSRECQNLKSLHHRRCCDASYYPLPIAQAPAPPPSYGMAPGPAPVCELCVDGSYPGNPFTLVAVLQIPEVKTCAQLYDYGQTGNIPDQICNPLVDYFEVPCGCGQGSAPVRSPTFGRPQAPAPAPTYGIPPGRSPVCRLCPDGSYPGDPHAAVTVMQVPEIKTCAQLFEYGETGNISNKLCSSVMDYYEGPCGCRTAQSSQDRNGPSLSVFLPLVFLASFPYPFIFFALPFLHRAQ